MVRLEAKNFFQGHFLTVLCNCCYRDGISVDQNIGFVIAKLRAI